MRPAPLFWLLAVCACAEPGPSAATGGDGCGAAAYGDLIGQPVSAFAARQGTGTVRIIRPGQPVTKDYNPARLNVMLDAQDRIIRMRCG